MVPPKAREPAHALAAGDDAFVGRAVSGIKPRPGVPSRYVRGPRPPLTEILAGEEPDSLLQAHAHGYSLREMARHLGCHASTVSRRLERLRQMRVAATRET
jgi:hypothetical protein